MYFFCHFVFHQEQFFVCNWIYFCFPWKIFRFPTHVSPLSSPWKWKVRVRCRKMHIYVLNYSLFFCLDYADCCAGEWDGECYTTAGDFNYQHSCDMCLPASSGSSGPCANDCEGAKESEACAECCRSQTHEVDWQCENVPVTETPEPTPTPTGILFFEFNIFRTFNAHGP